METKKKQKLTNSPHSLEDLKEKDLPFHYWGAMRYFLDLIKSSEIKAGLILSFYGIIFNFVYQNIDQAKSNFASFNFLHILAILWLITTLISIFYSVRSFIPRIEKNYEPNIFFFGDIVSKFGDIKEYSQKFLDVNVDKAQLYDQIGQQIYVNAKITTAKFKNVNMSLRYLLISMLLLLFFVIYTILNAIF
ncbi:Pycsar system effector family protein [Polaribacter sp.]|uniref:Pycsar system effector family protein n=1 Tax=Polaribacter sp. TaxID=1920175 RepID=UPI003EF60BF2